LDPEAAVIKEGLSRGVASTVSGEVKLELRRGEDYTVLGTDAVCSAYAPEKLSMEKTASAFSPEDRIGALEIQGISVLDNRAQILERARVGAKEPAQLRLDEITRVGRG
jgi:argininosuccinate synthase